LPLDDGGILEDGLSMRIIESISQLNKTGCVLSIGNFDGVHIGHSQILAVAKETAARRGTELVVLTFEPHPVMVLQPHKGIGVLTPMALKQHLLKQAGVDTLVVLNCDVELLSLSARDFVNRVLLDGIEPSVIVEGENFHFGAGRSGNVDVLRQLGAEAGFEIIVVEPEMVRLARGQIRSSSSLIRHLLQTGQVVDADAALGRPYKLFGQVVVGKGKGKRLGFPTANIEPSDEIIPADGVYAGFVAIAESRDEICKTAAKQLAALSIGRSRTYGADNPLLVEAHILEGKVDELYGKWLAMDFVGRIRDQKKFKTEKDLAEKIATDCEKARELLNDYHDKK